MTSLRHRRALTVIGTAGGLLIAAGICGPGARGAPAAGGAIPASTAPADSDAALVESESGDAPVPEVDPDDLGAPEPEAQAGLQGPSLPEPPPPPLAPSRFTIRWSGAVDFGFFVPEGDGAGWMQDLGPNRAFPAELGKWAWVFLGDIYSTAINTRGEPADLGNAPGVVRADSVGSRGAAGFIVNEANLVGTAGIGDSAIGTLSANVVPRSGANFSRGDSVELDLAQIEWLPTASQKTSIYAGKFESVVGVEYRERKAAQRFGITPSLISRYTTGTPLGLKIIHKIGDRNQLVLAGALTNGSSVVEPFHFQDEIDGNDGKTASGRVAGKFRGAAEFEIGASGSYGAQDRALDSRYPLWFGGFDLLFRYGRWDVKAQWLTGRGKGETDRLYEQAHRPYGLHLKQGAYLEGNVMVTPWLGLLGRGEFRDARVWLGNPDSPRGGDRLYITKSWRATAGVRIVFNARAVLKAEYLRNGEYGGIPDIANDVFTSSFVWTF